MPFSIRSNDILWLLPVKWASHSLIDSTDRQFLHAEASTIPVLRKQFGEIKGFSHEEESFGNRREWNGGSYPFFLAVVALVIENFLSER